MAKEYRVFIGGINTFAKQVMKGAAVVGDQERRPVPAPTQWIRAIHRCRTSGPQQRRARCRIGLPPASVPASLFATGWAVPLRADAESFHPKLSAPTVRSARPATSPADFDLVRQARGMGDLVQRAGNGRPKQRTKSRRECYHRNIRVRVQKSFCSTARVNR